MALSNEEVLGNLKVQLEEVQKQLDSLTTTRLKLIGAVDVLEQIEDSKKVDNPPEPVEEVVEPSPLEEVLEG